MKPVRLSDAGIRKRLKTLSGWVLRDGQIEKHYVFKDFKQAMALVLKAAFCAEAADHHPDIDVRYNKVTLRLSTHSAGGLTGKDFSLAAQIDS